MKAHRHKTETNQHRHHLSKFAPKRPMYEMGRITHTVDEVITGMYTGRTLDALTDVPVTDWELNELAYHHFTMSQMAPLMNSQGVSLHHQIIREIEHRGGLHQNEDHPASDGEIHNEHRLTF